MYCTTPPKAAMKRPPNLGRKFNSCCDAALLGKPSHENFRIHKRNFAVTVADFSQVTLSLVYRRHFHAVPRATKRSS